MSKRKKEKKRKHVSTSLQQVKKMKKKKTPTLFTSAPWRMAPLEHYSASGDVDSECLPCCTCCRQVWSHNSTTSLAAVPPNKTLALPLAVINERWPFTDKRLWQAN
ncbi:hypothetical protein BaRGS_00017068 [Batillaria attramentaria]|uniref:Uncharacterized protein n=1 Tax=Batillaria attramentaria TaxID=370345 RepID=A0ABD0KWR5_9CAEN